LAGSFWSHSSTTGNNKSNLAPLIQLGACVFQKN